MNLVDEIAKLRFKGLVTLDRKKPFKIINVTEKTIFLDTSTMPSRRVPVDEVKRAWRRLQFHHVLTREEIRTLGYSEFSPANDVHTFITTPEYSPSNFEHLDIGEEACSHTI